MLRQVPNPKSHPLLAKLNEKIDEYNDIRHKKLAYAGLLLEEINYMVFALKEQHMEACNRLIIDRDGDAIPIKVALQPIMEWNFLPHELAKRSQREACTGLAAEWEFISLQEGIERTTFNPLFLAQQNKLNHFIKKEKSLLNKAKSLDTEAKKLEYFYALKEMKGYLLQALAFDDRFSKEEIFILRSLLANVNQSLRVLIKNTPELKAKYEQHREMTREKFAENLSMASAKELMLLSVKLLKCGEAQQFDAIEQELVSLGLPRGCSIRRLGAGNGNNMNFSVTLPEDAGIFVIKIEKLHETPHFLSFLSLSPMQQYLLEEFFVSQPDLNLERLFTNSDFEKTYTLSLTEYAREGDLRAESEALHEEAKPPRDILISAARRLYQLIILYQCLKVLGGGHLDIKLTNILINAYGQLVLGDKKEIFLLLRPPMSCEGTAAYIPPELRNMPRIAGRFPPGCIDKAMVYQLGLAFYEYIVCPDNAVSWQDNLDFNLVYFQFGEGKLLGALIEQMTAPIYHFQDLSSLAQVVPNRPYAMAMENTFYIDRPGNRYVFCDSKGEVHEKVYEGDLSSLNEEDLKHTLIVLAIKQGLVPEAAALERFDLDQSALVLRNWLSQVEQQEIAELSSEPLFSSSSAFFQDSSKEERVGLRRTKGIPKDLSSYLPQEDDEEQVEQTESRNSFSDVARSPSVLDAPGSPNASSSSSSPSSSGSSNLSEQVQRQQTLKRRLSALSQEDQNEEAQSKPKGPG